MSAARKFLAVVLAASLTQGCASLPLFTDKAEKFCEQEQTAFEWAQSHTFDALDAYAAGHPEMAGSWVPLKEQLLEVQGTIDRACAESGASTGSVGEHVAKAAAFLVDALNLFGAIRGTRSTDAVNEREQAIGYARQMEGLKLEIERTTGDKAIGEAQERALRGGLEREREAPPVTPRGKGR